MLTGGEIDICARIQRARRAGNTRCGVVEGRMGVDEVARAFGLADDIAIYRAIDRAEADAIATRLLHIGLAYGVEMMSPSDAGDLWRQFKALFEGQDVKFFTNRSDTDFGAGSWSFAPATRATFDIGVLVIGATKAGCLWVEEED